MLSRMNIDLSRTGRTDWMRKMSKDALAVLGICILMLMPALAHALPQGGNVIGGSASISTPNSGTMNIVQSTNKAIINWQGFSIDTNELVKFVQPGSSAVALNRVVGIDPSSILGQLSANGKVFLVNPNGIYFGKNARVDAAGLLATTLNIKDNDFMSGNYSFTQDQDKALSYIINQGKIVINDNGFAVLVAPLVSNEGLIVANLGQVKIGAAEQFTVNFDGNGLINFAISNSNGQTPGTVLIPSSQVTDLIKAVVNTSQIVEAGQVIEENGVVKLVGASGVAINSGTIQANGAPGQKAGSIELNSTQATIVATGGLITANGVGENSSGGEIKILSDMQKGFTGLGLGSAIEAKGGITGAGGSVEISGHGFQTWGSIDVSATGGVAGTILLDPANITIVDSPSGTNASDYNFTGGIHPLPDNLGTGFFFATGGHDYNANGTLNEISSGYLTTLAGTIVLQATNSITINQITLNPLTWASPTNLVLQAGGKIAFSSVGPFTINTDGGSIQLEADSPHSVAAGGLYDGNGKVDLGSVTLNTGGGNVTIIAGANTATPIDATAATPPSINAGAGNVNLAYSNGLNPVGGIL